MRTRLIFAFIVSLLCVAAFWLLKKQSAPLQTTHREQQPTRLAAAPHPSPVVSTGTTARVDAPQVIPQSKASPVAQFNAWTARYFATAPAERSALIAEGRALAAARRKEFFNTITRDPRRALQEAVPPVVRQELPAEIVTLLEERVNVRGSLVTYLSTPVEGAVQPPVLRYAKTESGREYQAHTFGRDEFAVAEQPGRSLIGVALADENGKAHLALSDSRVRRLDVGERPDPTLERIRVCPVSGKTIALPESESAAPITDNTPAVEANGQIVHLCDGAHTTLLDEQLIYAEGATGGAQRVSGNFPYSTSKSVGVLRVMYVPLTFLDQNAAPASEDTCYEVMAQVADFYQKQSFGKLTVQTTVTPPVRLPRTEAYYIAKDGEIDGLALEHSDAMSEARKLGYDSNDYDTLVVRLNGGPRASGGWGGGNRVWTYHDDAGIVAHEIGHTFGLAHANFWDTGGVSAIGGGTSQEYGDQWDVMGRGGVPNGHYNIWAKGTVNWVPAVQLWDVKQSGTYRIFAHDANTLEPARCYGMKVTKDSARTYYIETRQLRDGDPDKVWLKYGAILEWRWSAKAGNNLLLDTTPGSLFGKDDGGLVLGRTFSDREAGLHFTPVAVTFGAQKSVDIVVNVGQFPGNSPPALALSASTINVAVNAPVTIDATATDADGDTLGYFWETGDKQVYPNAAQFTRTFTTAGMYWVACTASDMKGGTTMRYAIVNVGAHSEFSIGGRVALGGIGMPGVLVRATARQAYTDADGFYTLAGLDAGTQTLTVSREGFTFTGSTTLTVGPNVANADFTAVTGTLLSISATLPMAAEGGAPGRFTLTRTGDTTAALTVQVETLSGTATKTTDYTLTPDVATNTFTIPAGQSSLNINLAPVDDASAEGPETATIQLVPSPAYVISGLGEATVTISDNDTALPLVSIAATLAHTVENDPAPAQFTVTRAGAIGSALTVNYTISGTATNGVDYIALPGSVTFPIGAASANIAITTINDSLNEGSETVTLTLASNAAYLVGTNAATATIVDDDQQLITVTATDASAAETSAGAPNPGVFLVARTGDIAQALTVYYSLAGTAIHGADFEILPGSVTIPAGQSSAAVTILPIADGIGEGSETVQLLLASVGTQYQFTDTSTATVTIADNPADPVIIEVRADDGFAQEGGNNGTFRLTARGGNGDAITVNYAMSGTAINGTDYAALGGTATIPAGSGTRTVDVAIAPIQDAIAEPIETVTLSVNSGSGYTFWPQTGSATMWLRDDEAPTVFADAHKDAPAEGALTSKFYLSRTGSTTGALDVSFTLTGTATNGVDYAAIPLTATIPDGASGVNVNVTPFDDALAEGTETIILTLASGSYSASPVPALLYLTDNEAPVPVVQFAQASAAGQENVGTVNIPVSLTGALTAPATVEYSISSGTGTSLSTIGSRVSFPYWVRLVRTGDIVTAYRSADGFTWTQHGAPQQLAMANPALVGLAVCSVNDGTLATGVFDNVTVTGGGGAWLSRDIGNTAAPGSYTQAGSMFTVLGSGADIFGSSDEFRYVYQTLAGDGSITARVLSLMNTNASAKAGVMIREDITNFSRHVLMELQADADPEMIVRASGRDTALGAGVDFTLPGGPVGMLTFNPGVTTLNIPLTIIDDTIREFGERVIIKLRNANGASIGPQSEFTYSIGDNDGTIDAWRLVHFGADAGNPLIAGDLADPELDGLVNLLEYAQNLDPNAASAGPVFGIEPGFVTLTYRRNLAATDITFTVQETVSLTGINPWTTASVTEEILSDDGMTRVIKAKAAIGAESAHYLRLQVTRN